MNIINGNSFIDMEFLFKILRWSLMTHDIHLKVHKVPSSAHDTICPNKISISHENEFVKLHA